MKSNKKQRKADRILWIHYYFGGGSITMALYWIAWHFLNVDVKRIAENKMAKNILNKMPSTQRFELWLFFFYSSRLLLNDIIKVQRKNVLEM